MSTEVKLLARQQVVEAVRYTENLTLKYDGTIKRVGHIVETEFATDSQSLSRHLPTEVVLQMSMLNPF